MRDVHQRPESTELELRAGFEDQSLPSLLSEERFGIKPLNTRVIPSISFVCIYSVAFPLGFVIFSSLVVSKRRASITCFGVPTLISSRLPHPHFITIKMDPILDGLNAAQRTAVTSPAPVLQVLAPPGSGKTKPHIASRLPSFERLPTTEHIMFDIHDQELRNAR
jgi:hypothetical protein